MQHVTRAAIYVAEIFRDLFTDAEWMTGTRGDDTS